MVPMLLLLQIAVTLPDHQPVAADTPHGPFVFDFLKTSIKDGRCIVSAHVENRSDTSCDHLKFLISFDAEDNESHSWSIGVPVSISDLGWNQSLWDVTGICPDVLPALRLKDLRVSLISGDNLADALERAEKREQLAAQARRTMIAKAPKLQNALATSAFVAADRKCLDQAISAISKGEGVEPRKALAELVQYGCGFPVPNGAAVRINATDGNKTSITLLDTNHEGESGWVLTTWVAQSAVK
jgi:hypothetical protein